MTVAAERRTVAPEQRTVAAERRTVAAVRTTVAAARATVPAARGRVRAVRAAAPSDRVRVGAVPVFLPRNSPELLRESRNSSGCAVSFLRTAIGLLRLCVRPARAFWSSSETQASYRGRTVRSRRRLRLCNGTSLRCFESRMTDDGTSVRWSGRSVSQACSVAFYRAP